MRCTDADTSTTLYILNDSCHSTHKAHNQEMNNQTQDFCYYFKQSQPTD